MKNWIKAIGIVALKILLALFAIFLIGVCIYLLIFLFPSLLLHSGILHGKMGMTGARLCEGVFIVCAGILIFWIRYEHEQIEDYLQYKADLVIREDGYAINIDGEDYKKPSFKISLREFNVLKIDHHKKIIYLGTPKLPILERLEERLEEILYRIFQEKE